MAEPTNDRVHAVVMTERIRATPEEVFDFLVDPDKLIRWMGTTAEVDPRPGGVFRVNVTGDDIARGTYVTVERPRRVVVSWGWEGSDHVPPGSTTVSFELTADGEETVVELVHAGLPGGQDDEHRTGWAHYLPRLGRAAAGLPLDTEGPPAG